ncbi:MAG TPA: gephyrin-like molybdotransferase Glp [Thermomicrobiales bacterium]|nr:gephyrin-like molybdotransferase Glp [Thermomicrobiales bacterium]
MTDHQALQELDRMRPPDEARRVIEAHLPTLPTEHVPLTEALGRVLVEDIAAPFDHPPFPASTMDGFAVLAADASPWREVIGEQPAGTMIAEEVHDGQAVRIMTGAPIPTGADAVVPVEETSPAEDHVVIHAEDVTPGTNIRPVGSDLKRGEVVLRTGTRLHPAHIGLIASVGIAQVPVRRRPRVSILATGDEVMEPGSELKPGQIYDANRFSLSAAVLDAGGEITWSGLAPDRRDQLEALLRERMETDDIILTSGGISMGELDLIKAILFDAPDVTVHFRRLFMKPGKPLNFATRGDALIFGLPGNPVSSLVTFELFLRPAMAIMSGDSKPNRPRVPVTLSSPAAPSDRIEYQRARVTVTPEGKLVGASTGPQQSSRLASFVGANALLVIPPRETSYEPGEMVEALLLAPPDSESR